MKFFRKISGCLISHKYVVCCMLKEYYNQTASKTVLYKISASLSFPDTNKNLKGKLISSITPPTSLEHSY
jgi:hypothetical protein